MVNISIDGKQIEVPEGTTVLQAAQKSGITIPTLCDHPNLTPYGGCRLCLVEIEGMRTLQPSCTMPASKGMIVHTDTERTREARKFVLTLIFSERNHFCMYCQVSDGDCELQNAAYAEHMTHWPLQPNWKPYEVDATNPYFVLDNNRCILCRRCVRACGELVGNYTLGIEERGADSLLVADFGVPLGESTCVSCGTCVQICPTGALIDRISAYQGKETQVETTPSICLACSLGCGVKLLSRDNRMVRIEGDWEAAINGGVLCEAGRFLPMADDRERVLTPLVRRNGALKAATWDEALDLVAAKLKAGKAAAVASTRLPAEALSAFKQVFADGCATFEEGAATAAATRVARDLGRPFEGSLNVLDKADFVLLAGVDLAKDHQVAGFFVKRGLPEGVGLAVISSGELPFKDLADHALQPKPGTEAELLLGVLAELARSGKANGQAAPTGATLASASQATGVPAEAIQALAEALGAAQRPAFVYGEGIAAQGAPAAIKALLDLARASGGLDDAHSAVISVKGGANSAAAALYGLEGEFKLDGAAAVYVALGDDQINQRQLKRLEGAPFLAVQSAYITPLTAAADVVLPVENWAELEGHYVNSEGRLQAARRALTAPEGVWSNLAVLDALAARLGIALDADWQAGLARGLAAVPLMESQPAEQ